MSDLVKILGVIVVFRVALAHLTLSTCSLEAAINSTVTFVCQTDGDVSQICWKYRNKSNPGSNELLYRDGRINRKLFPTRLTVTNCSSNESQLTISEVTESDEGIYICSECSEYKKEISTHLTVLVNGTLSSTNITNSARCEQPTVTTVIDASLKTSSQPDFKAPVSAYIIAGTGILIVIVIGITIALAACCKTEGARPTEARQPTEVDLIATTIPATPAGRQTTVLSYIYAEVNRARERRNNNNNQQRTNNYDSPADGSHGDQPEVIPLTTILPDDLEVDVIQYAEIVPSTRRENSRRTCQNTATSVPSATDPETVTYAEIDHVTRAPAATRPPQLPRKLLSADE